MIVAEGQGRWQEYAGGYTDMLAQRGSGIEAKTGTAAAPEKAGARTAAASVRPPERRRLSFKQQQALRTLPARIEALHAKLAALQATLSDPALYARDQGAFGRASEDLVATQADLAAAEEEWLALEILREEIESG